MFLTDIRHRRRRIEGRSAQVQRGAIGGIPEQVIVGAVATVVVVAALAAGMNLFNSSKVEKETMFLNNIINGTRGLYSGQNGFGTGSLNAVLMASGVIPDAMIVSNSPVNSWGGAVTVTGATANFTVTYAAVPMEPCMQMVVKTPADGFRSVQAGTVTWNAAAFPVTPAQAQAACTDAVSNTIVWTVSQ